MAEYMDISRIDDWDNLSIIDDDGNAKYVYDVGELPKTDVVDRSEYETLRLVILDLAETNKALLAEHQQLFKLRSNIDDAIEDMKFNIECNTDPNTGLVNLLGQGQIMMLNVLKKYIGEE